MFWSITSIVLFTTVSETDPWWRVKLTQEEEITSIVITKSERRAGKFHYHQYCSHSIFARDLNLSDVRPGGALV